MTMQDAVAKYVGKEGSILLNGLRINVKCLDIKEVYGKRRWLISPLSGVGQTWTEQEPLERIADR